MRTRNYVNSKRVDAATVYLNHARTHGTQASTSVEHNITF